MFCFLQRNFVLIRPNSIRMDLYHKFLYYSDNSVNYIVFQYDSCYNTISIMGEYISIGFYTSQIIGFNCYFRNCKVPYFDNMLLM